MLSAGSDQGKIQGIHMAGEESETLSSKMEEQLAEEKTMSETPLVDVSPSPLPQTPNASRPTSLHAQRPTDSDSDSGSDYSQPQSPNGSRPSSMQLHSHISTNNEPTDQKQSRSSGSDHSQPQPAQQSGASSTQSLDAEQVFEEVSLDDEPRSLPPPESTQLQQPRSSADSAIHQQHPRLSLDTSPYEPSPPAESSSNTSHPASPEGSNYSGSPPQSPKSPRAPTVPVSSMTPQEAHMSIDSLQSIALSESSLDYDHLATEQVDDVLATPRVSGIRHMRKPSSLEILQNSWGLTRQSTFFDSSKDEPLDTPANGPADDEDDDNSNVDYESASSTPSVTFMDTSTVWTTQRFSSLGAVKRGSRSSEEEDLELDWQALDETEEQEKEDRDLPAGTEDETTAFLLARLEQENAKFSADPKSAAGVAMNKQFARVRSKSRPPSMAHLKKLVEKQDAPSIRYSLAPDVQEQLPEEVPPMTELEFWAALVQDYPTTASRLPTLTTTKIRAGIPPPLRSVVWASMSGAREKDLEEAFEQLKGEKTPYEGIINKDVGRSFPGVELFRDAEGEGQKMLGRVLKCFSLYDKDIGYCQGLGFLVGPLLMNMGEKEAFCVLVRLMDHYALRPSFLPSLSGLHMRIFQFSNLLAQHHPELSEHLTHLGVEPAYLSQWFLSCFAVTCPLPMLFRIYDVIFAEGANETVMRVALALFRRNEAKMLASTEFEEVMQLLLGRAIWDCYGCNPDEMVDDFTSLGGIITHAKLAELEKEYEGKDAEAVGQSAGFLPDVQAAASRFLGRLWAPNHSHTPSKAAAATLSPQSTDKDAPAGGLLSRPSSFLRRSPSKQSMTTLNNDSSSSEGSTSSGAISVLSTAATEGEVHDAASRESQVDTISLQSKSDSLRTVSVATSGTALLSTTPVMKEQELNTQIEDLLMALSEMQRAHAHMVAMLQKEREDRNDDHRVVRQLLNKLGKAEVKGGRRSMPPPPRPKTRGGEDTTIVDKRRTLPPRPRPEVKEVPVPEIIEPKPMVESNEELDRVLQEVQTRLETNARFSASFETKAQLRSTLSRTREQLATAETQVKTLSERAEFAENSLMTFQGESESLRAEVEELRTRVNDDFKEKKKLELKIENMEIQMRMEAKALEKRQKQDRLVRAESSGEVPTLRSIDTKTRSRNGSISSAPGSAGGLRELKLTRRDSVGSVQSIRSLKSPRNTDQWPTSPNAVDVLPSPPPGPATEAAPTPPPKPATIATAPETVPLAPASQPATTAGASSLAVPGPYFGRRTTSLATKDVFATPQHEPVPDEALLLELVNAKTAEATARQELDELKKSLQTQRKRAEESYLQLQAEAASARLEAEQAKEESERAREEARAAREEIFDASPLHTPGISMPVTPAPEDMVGKSGTPPAEKSVETPPSSGGGWFWSRRTASTAKAAVN